MSTAVDPAEEQFHTSSCFPSAPSVTRWKIRNDYPLQSSEPEGDWYNIDVRVDLEHRKKFLEAAKEYILKGNVKNNFVVQDNHERNWYHAPWLHYGSSGREPANGLFWAPPRFLSQKTMDKKQKSQVWGNSFFNDHAATALHGVWGENGKSPKWNEHLVFPNGSFMFLLVFTDATAEDVDCLKHSPEFQACIAEGSGEDPAKRNLEPTLLRLLQVDFRARVNPDIQSEIGWVFGSFGWNGNKITSDAITPEEKWRQGLVLLGFQWGNDPNVTDTSGEKLEQIWWNEDGHQLMKDFYSFPKVVPEDDGKGWGGRLAGPSEEIRFMQACASCHSVAQVTPTYEYRMETPLLQTPQPVKVTEAGKEKWVQQFPEAAKTWFRNIKPGESFSEDSKSADYNHGAHFGYENYLHWSANRKNKLEHANPPLPDIIRAKYGF